MVEFREDLMREGNTISYTSNEVGSGVYCKCGQELTKDELEARRFGSRVCLHGRRGNVKRS